MKLLIIIGIGGFIGSVARYLLNNFIQNALGISFPFGTLTINIIGCFVIGIVLALNLKTGLSNETYLFLTAGLCGGFTTFSAFSVETIALMREGQVLNSLFYILLSVVGGIASAFAGFSLFRNL